jgi:hypothetical protein
VEFLKAQLDKVLLLAVLIVAVIVYFHQADEFSKGLITGATSALFMALTGSAIKNEPK